MHLVKKANKKLIKQSVSVSLEHILLIYELFFSITSYVDVCVCTCLDVDENLRNYAHMLLN